MVRAVDRTNGGAHGGGGGGAGRVVKLQVAPADIAPSRCLLQHLEVEPPPSPPLQPLQPLPQLDVEGEEGLEWAEGEERLGRPRHVEGAQGAGAADQQLGEVVLQAGQWARAALFGCDAHGNALPLHEAQRTSLEVSFTRASDGSAVEAHRLRAEVGCDRRGAVWVRHCCVAAGRLHLSVRLGGQHVHGSPMRLRVAPGPALAAACAVRGAADEP